MGYPSVEDTCPEREQDGEPAITSATLEWDGNNIKDDSVCTITTTTYYTQYMPEFGEVRSVTEDEEEVIEGGDGATGAFGRCCIEHKKENFTTTVIPEDTFG